jgi:hypothetical protein
LAIELDCHSPSPRRLPARSGGRSASWRVPLASCAAALAVSSSAIAQTASPEDVASARALGIEGVRLADSGDCAAAVPKLEAAEKLYHAPTTLERLGACQIGLGHLVAGTESLNRVLRETLPPNAPAAFVTAQQRAGQLLATAKPRIGKVRIHIEGAPLDKVTVTVDGSGVPAALFDVDRATDPGSHEVKGAAPGYRTAIIPVQVPEGGEATVSLRLEPDPAAAVTAASGESPLGQPNPVAPAGPTTPPAVVSSGPNRAPAIVAFVIGGAGVVAGSVFGIMALGTKSSLDGACTSKVCPPTSQSDIDSLSTRATIANIGFGVGIVGIVVGTVLLVTTHGAEARTAATSPSERPRRVRPWVGLGAAGIAGSFE